MYALKILIQLTAQQFFKKIHVQIKNALKKVLRSHLLQRPGKSDKKTLILGPTILQNLATMIVCLVFKGNLNKENCLNFKIFEASLQIVVGSTKYAAQSSHTAKSLRVIEITRLKMLSVLRCRKNYLTERKIRKCYKILVLSANEVLMQC